MPVLSPVYAVHGDHNLVEAVANIWPDNHIISNIILLVHFWYIVGHGWLVGHVCTLLASRSILRKESHWHDQQMFSFDADVLIGFLFVYMVKAVKVVKLKNVLSVHSTNQKFPTMTRMRVHILSNPLFIYTKRSMGSSSS